MIKAFYRNDHRPRTCAKIDDIHRSYSDHDLEYEHGYIQWLFPTFTKSSFSDAHILTDTTCRELRQDAAILLRFLYSYVRFAQFVGLCVADIRSGELRRGYDFEVRIRNVNMHRHNYLRFTRIMYSLNALGFAVYRRPLYNALMQCLGDGAICCSDKTLQYWEEAMQQPAFPENALLQRLRSSTLVRVVGNLVHDSIEAPSISGLFGHSWQREDTCFIRPCVEWSIFLSNAHRHRLVDTPILCYNTTQNIFVTQLKSYHTFCWLRTAAAAECQIHKLISQHTDELVQRCNEELMLVA